MQALAGAVIEVAQPLESTPDDFKVVFNQPDVRYSTPAPPNVPGPPVTLTNGVTKFNQTGPAMTLVTFKPCSTLAAHIHPRGTEFGYVTAGAVQAEIFQEDGKHVAVTYEAGQGLVFPQGSVHLVRNTLCNQSEFLAFFDSPNPGVVFASQALHSFSPDYLGAAFPSGLPPTDPGNVFPEHSCGCPV